MDSVRGLSANASAAEIENELVFERVLLDSLDPNGYDYDNQMRERQARIETLETALERANTSSSNSNFGTTAGYSVHEVSQQPGDFASMLGPVARYNHVDEAGSNDHWPSPSTLMSMPTLEAPSSFTVDAMSRKRPHTELSSPTMADFQNAKRHTPSPANSMSHTPQRSRTPERVTSNLFLDPPRSTFGVHASQGDLLRQHQRRAELQAAQRKQQLECDMMFASALAKGERPQRAPPGRPSSQTVFNRDGTIRNPFSDGNANGRAKVEAGYPLRPPQSEGLFMPSRSNSSSIPVQTKTPSIVKREVIGPSTVNFKRETSGAPNVKLEPSRRPDLFHQPREVQQIIDLSDSESSSEIEEIDAGAFQAAAAARGRDVSTNPMISRQQFPQRSDGIYAQQARTYKMPGAFPNAQQISYGQPSPTPYPSTTASMLRQIQQQNAMDTQNGMNRSQLQASYNNDARAMILKAAMSRSPTMSMGMPGAFPGSMDLLQNPYLSHLPTASYGSSSQKRVPPYTEVIDLEDSDDDYRRKPYAHLYNDPTRSAEEIKQLIENIASGGDLTPEARLGTPAAMVFPLMEHQKIGLTWLKAREEGHSKGGILADDMGLGKTIQAIALMVSRPSEDPQHKTTLIVAPVTLLRQWALEIKEKLTPGKGLSVHIHHSARKKPYSQLRRFDVVLTTYGSLSSELKRKERWDRILANNPSAVPTKKEELSLLGPGCSWYRIILDEAQCVKNRGTGAAKAVFHLQGTYRLCMTGTPMMNNVGELFSLIHFCKIKPYNAIERFRHEIQNPLNKGTEEERKNAMQRLQGLVRAIMLRRTKSSKLDGKPIITLEPRTTDIINGTFDRDQEDFYRALEDRSAAVFNRYLKAGTVLKNYSSILALLLRLRQVCDHPQLATDYGTDGAAEASSGVVVDLARQLSDDVVRRIKGAGGEFTCPICIDAIPPPGPVIFFPCGHVLDNDCMSNMVSSALANGGESELKCPECRTRLKQTEVIDYPTFKKVHMPEEYSQDGEQGGDVDSDSDSDIDSSEEESETSSLDGFIVGDDTDDDGETAPEARTKMEKEHSTDVKQARRPERKAKKNKGKQKSDGETKKKERKSFAQLRAESLHSKAARKKYMRRLEKSYEPSAKIQKILELLSDITTNKPREKILIFSQFTSFLDILEIPLMHAQHQYLRFDGSMSAQDRDSAVQIFRENANIKIMLISLKAGNAGLNLNCASQVIILDPFWNPYIEEQAIDRAHRIGQLNTVNVHRIVIPNTVEDRILELQEKKREMISTALDENAGKSLARLGERELGYLFGVFRNASS